MKQSYKNIDSDSDSSAEVVLEDEDEDYETVEECCCVGCVEDYSTTSKSVKWLHENCTKYGDWCHVCAGKKR